MDPGAIFALEDGISHSCCQQYFDHGLSFMKPENAANALKRQAYSIAAPECKV